MVSRSAWRLDPSVSPFGIGLRDLEYDSAPPADEHVYIADWMGPDAAGLGVFTPRVEMEEPWMFRMTPEWTVPPRERKTGWQVDFIDHPNGARVLTSAEITVAGEVSAALRAVEAESNFTIVEGEEHLVTLTFDDHVQGKMVDFRPESPLVIKY